MAALRSRTVSVACALTLALGCIPAQALAEASGDQPQTAQTASAGQTAVAPTGRHAYAAADGDIALQSVNLNATVKPHDAFSDEFLYFSEFESGKNYNLTLSAGDGFHAMGCYQFDNRYGLQDFLIACYNYGEKNFDVNPYASFGWLKDDTLDLSTETLFDWDAGQFTDIGIRLNDSWTEAYNANPENFSRLQDGWFYQEYAELALSLCDDSDHNFNMEGRADCVKGLVSGICNLFGSGGMQFFVGGTLYGKTYAGANLKGTMTDREFVTTLCDYIVDNVADFPYVNQEYVQGYQNRYEREKEVCLSYLPEDPAPDPTPEPDPAPALTDFVDVASGDWYESVVKYVSERHIMNGHEESGSWYFNPNDDMARGMVVTVLWRMQGEPKADVNEETFADVDYNAYYGTAIRWAKAVGIVNGYTDSKGRDVFEPDRAVTREELAVIFANFAQKMDGKRPTSDAANLVKFPDAKAVDSWAKNAVSWAVDSGLISGVVESDGKYIRPVKTATRAEAAAIFTRYLQNR